MKARPIFQTSEEYYNLPKTETMKTLKLKGKKRIKFSDLPDGSLFLYNDTIALKTEYLTNDYSDAYIVGSGEYFWGGTNNAIDRDNLEVIELKVKNSNP